MELHKNNDRIDLESETSAEQQLAKWLNRLLMATQ